MRKVAGLLRMGVLALTLMVALAGTAIGLLDAANLGVAWSGVDQNVSAQVPTYTCSIKVPEPEPADLSTLAKIKADQAMAAALAAFPGAAVRKVELGNENGCLVYDVALSNGLEVKVDAGNGAVLHKAPANSEDDDEDNEDEGDAKMINHSRWLGLA